MGGRGRGRGEGRGYGGGGGYVGEGGGGGRGGRGRDGGGRGRDGGGRGGRGRSESSGRGDYGGRGGRGDFGGRRGGRGDRGGGHRGGGRGPPPGLGSATESLRPLPPPAFTLEQLNLSTEVEGAPAELGLQEEFTQVRRPGLGKVGRQVVLYTNQFKFSFLADKAVFWRVDFTQIDTRPEDKRDRPLEQDDRMMPKKKSRALLGKVAESQGWENGWAFDGRSTLVAPKYFMAQHEQAYQVDDADPNRPGRGRVRQYMVTFKWTKTVDLRQFATYFSQPRPGVPQDALQALDIVLRNGQAANPALKQVGRGFYFATPQAHPIRNCAEVWLGFQESIRPTQSGLTLTINNAATPMLQPINVVEYVAAMLKLEASTLAGQLAGARSRTRTAVKKLLTDLMVEPEVREDFRSRRRYKVKGITDNPANQLIFTLGRGENTEEISVSAYYERQYTIRLTFPNLPCLDCGTPRRPVWLPMELFRLVPGQRKLKITDDMVSDIGHHTIKGPAEKQDLILTLAAKANFPADTTLRSWGIGIDNNMQQVTGRILPVDKLVYGNNLQIDPGTTGAWNLKEVSFVKGMPVNSWAVITCCGRVDNYLLTFLDDLTMMLNKSGVMTVPQPPVIVAAGNRDGPSNIEGDMRKACEQAVVKFKANPQIIVVMINRRAADVYKSIKRVSDSVLGIPSQVFTAKQAGVGPNMQPKGRLQYCANLAMKINAKVGGKNLKLYSGLKSLLPSDYQGKVFMLMGADVAHPRGHEKNDPSIAAVVASMDIECAHYATRIMRQEHRQEIIAGMKDATRDLLLQFYGIHGKLPEVIIMFRDGVSEGQFKEVLESEKAAIMQGAVEATNSPAYQPALTFVTVQKRHQTRFFPKNPRESGQADRNGNILPGTVVDTAVCHPFAFDFYLASHAAIKGTSRPCHYYCLHDDLGFTADQLQQLSYRLCYLYCRCTRSVSLVPPAYYADLAAARGRVMIRGYYDDSASESTSVAGTEGSETPLTFMGINPALNNTMFWA